MTKFKEYFNDPQYFTGYEGGILVINAEDYTKEEALAIYNKEYEVEIDSIEEDRVRYGFAGECIEDREELVGQTFWQTGATGRGSKKVWITRKWKDREGDN